MFSQVGKDKQDNGQFPTTVTFTSATGDPLPHADFLALHCAICRVLHASGAAEALDLLFRDWGETMVLASDGSSADLLSVAMQRSISICVP